MYLDKGWTARVRPLFLILSQNLVDKQLLILYNSTLHILIVQKYYYRVS